jgi:hypothetical protein
MTELIVAFLKLCVWDPNWDALYFLEHTLVDTTFEIVLERVGVSAESSNPEFPLDPGSHAEHGIVQSTVGVGVRLRMPSRLGDQGITICSTIC